MPTYKQIQHTKNCAECNSFVNRGVPVFRQTSSLQSVVLNLQSLGGEIKIVYKQNIWEIYLITLVTAKCYAVKKQLFPSVSGVLSPNLQSDFFYHF